MLSKMNLLFPAVSDFFGASGLGADRLDGGKKQKPWALTCMTSASKRDRTDCCPQRFSKRRKSFNELF